MIGAVEEVGQSRPGTVATVGRIEALPGAINVIPGEVRFTMDVRAPDDAVRAVMVQEIDDRLRAIAERRGLGITITRTQDSPAARCTPWLMEQLDAAIAGRGIRPFRLPSGAGHDAMIFAGLWPIGMLFMRCGGGISHNAAESVTVEDTQAALDVLFDFIEAFQPQL
jgi:allantoate deiminase